MLFGATSCACGYTLAAASPEESPLEVSYWEALRAYWRVYWPAQVIALLFLVAETRALVEFHRRSMAPLPASPWVELVVTAVTLFFFVSRLVSHAYRGFSLVTVSAAGETGHRLRLGQRAQVWYFLWWRQLAAGLAAMVLAAPLNVLLALMGFRISQQVATVAGLFIIGPILVKMLVGYPFPAFSIEARRR
jgi:hypothetical protein